MKRLTKITMKKLSLDEMKSITGKQSVCCFSGSGNWFYGSADVGEAWCYVWEGFGYWCECRTGGNLYYCN